MTWIDTDVYPDGFLSFRLLLAENQNVRALKNAIDRGHANPEIAPYVPPVAFCSREDFEAGGFDGCPAAR